MPAVQVLSKLIYDEDTEVLKNSLWALAFLGFKITIILRRICYLGCIFSRYCRRVKPIVTLSLLVKVWLYSCFWQLTSIIFPLSQEL